MSSRMSGTASRILARLIAMATLSVPAPVLATEAGPAVLLNTATALLSEILALPDGGIPADLWARANCIVIVPGFSTADRYGKGVVCCRKQKGTGWASPGMVHVESGGGSFSSGGWETDLVMLVMTERGVNRVLEDKFTVGVDGSAAAGPIGRTARAQTAAQLHADVLSWSRTGGLLASFTLEGVTLRPDLDDNTKLYGKTLTNAEIVTQAVPVPKIASRLIGLLKSACR